MRRWAEFVLRHRRLVMLFWLLVIIVGAGISSTVNDRLTVDFSLPGQPGTKAANEIKALVGNGGDTNPYVVTVTLPAGQKITGNEAAVGKTFDGVVQNVPNVRVVDEANTGDKAFRTKDDRTAYALVFYRFNPSPKAKGPPRPDPRGAPRPKAGGCCRRGDRRGPLGRGGQQRWPRG